MTLCLLLIQKKNSSMSRISDLVISLTRNTTLQKLKLEHLLMSWIEDECNQDLIEILQAGGLTIANLREILRDFQSTTPLTELILNCSNGFDLFEQIIKSEHELLRRLHEAGFALEAVRKVLKKKKDKNMIQDKYSVLESYGRNLTKQATDGMYDHLGDREDILWNIVTALQKAEKNNVILVGETGVGKTALVELLAKQSVNDKIPGINSSTEIIEVSPSSLIAGKIYVGSLQQAVKDLISMVMNRPNNVILFMDEFHTIIGAGGTHVSNMDIANQLKPILTDRRFRVIGSTTSDEYETYLKQDKAFLRRFETIEVPPPDHVMNYKMCKSKVKLLSEVHGVRYNDKVIVRAIELTNKHQPEQYQPDKTIDLLDRVGVLAMQEGKKAVELLDLYECLAERKGIDISDLLKD